MGIANAIPLPIRQSSTRTPIHSNIQSTAVRPTSRLRPLTISENQTVRSISVKRASTRRMRVRGVPRRGMINEGWKWAGWSDHRRSLLDQPVSVGVYSSDFRFVSLCFVLCALCFVLWEKLYNYIYTVYFRARREHVICASVQACMHASMSSESISYNPTYI